MKKIKKFVFLSLATALLVAPMSSFADSSIITSKEGVGINVTDIIMQNKNSRSTTQGNKVNVLGGKLWTTWRDGRDFRANYDHSSKVHMCTAQNANGIPVRGSWTSKGRTATSPWVYQTAYGNRIFGNTK